MTNAEPAGALGLDDRTRALLEAVFARHPRVSQAWLFGSRAMGTYRPESDVDIALYGDVDEAFAARIAGELEDLPLPYTFDVQAYSCIRHVRLREHIDRVGCPIFVRSSTDPSDSGSAAPQTVGRASR